MSQLSQQSSFILIIDFVNNEKYCFRQQFRSSSSIKSQQVKVCNASVNRPLTGTSSHCSLLLKMGQLPRTDSWLSGCKIKIRQFPGTNNTLVEQNILEDAINCLMFSFKCSNIYDKEKYLSIERYVFLI